MEIVLNNNRLPCLQDNLQLITNFNVSVFEVKIGYLTNRGNEKERSIYIVDFINTKHLKFKNIDLRAESYYSTIVIKHFDNFNRAYPFRKLHDIRIKNVNDHLKFNILNLDGPLIYAKEGFIYLNIPGLEVNKKDVIINDYYIREVLTEFKNNKRNVTTLYYVLNPRYNEIKDDEIFTKDYYGNYTEEIKTFLSRKISLYNILRSDKSKLKKYNFNKNTFKDLSFKLTNSNVKILEFALKESNYNI